MSRRPVFATAVAAAVGVAAVGWDRAGGTPARSQPTDLGHLWQWPVAPPVGSRPPVEVTLVARTRADRSGGALRPGPLRPGDGVGRVVLSDVLTDTRPGSLAVQLVDLRRFGVAPGRTDNGLIWAQAAMRSAGGMARSAAPLDGFTPCGVPHVHGGGWADGERPLVTVFTADRAARYTHTFVLVAAPYRP